MTGQVEPDFDGCHRTCRIKGAHSLIWGGCEHAVPPEPTVSLSVTYTDHNGHPSIGFDTYTVQQLAGLITPALCTGDAGWPIPFDEQAGHTVALRVAHAIVHRNDPAPMPAPEPAATDGWEQQDDGTWTLPVDGGTILFTRRTTAEERARFAAAWKTPAAVPRFTARPAEAALTRIAALAEQPVRTTPNNPATSNNTKET